MEGSFEEDVLTAFLMNNSAVGHEAAQKSKARLAVTEETNKIETAMKRNIDFVVSMGTKRLVLFLGFKNSAWSVQGVFFTTLVQIVKHGNI